MTRCELPVMFYLYFRAVSDTFRRVGAWRGEAGRLGRRVCWRDRTREGLEGAAAGVSAHFPFLALLVAVVVVSGTT